MTNWKFTDASGLVVYRTNANGSMESCAVDAIGEWLAAGNTPEPAEPLPNPRIAEIQLRLLKIDQESVRALRGQAVRGRPADITKLTKLEDEADTLRSELIGL